MRYIILHMLMMIDAMPINEQPTHIVANRTMSQNFVDMLITIATYDANTNIVVMIAYNINLPDSCIAQPNNPDFIFALCCDLSPPINGDFIYIISILNAADTFFKNKCSHLVAMRHLKVMASSIS